MKTRKFFTLCLSLTLVVAFAASGFALPWSDTTTSTSKIYAWDGAYSGDRYLRDPGTGQYLRDPLGNKIPDPSVTRVYSDFWNSGNIAVTGGAAPLQFTLKGVIDGTWDKNPVGHPATLPGTDDFFKVEIYFNGSLLRTYSNDQVDRKNDDIQWLPATLASFQVDNKPGVYAFRAWGAVTEEAETWKFTSADLKPTPLPGAVWLLGSGLLGFMGFKRSRKNAA